MGNRKEEGPDPAIRETRLLLHCTMMMQTLFCILFNTDRTFCYINTMKLQNVSVMIELISVFAGRSEQDELVAMGTNWNRSGRSFSNGGSAIQMLQGNGPSRKFGSRNNITGLNGNYRSHCHKDGEFHDCVAIVVFCLQWNYCNKRHC